MKRLKSLNSLTTRIFAIFWLTLAIVLMFVLLIPSLDGRQLKELSNNEFKQIQRIKIELERVLDESTEEESIFWRKMLSRRFIVVTPEGNILGTPMHQIRNVRNFIGLSDNAERPMKKTYDKIEYIGPFLIHYNTRPYLIFLHHPAKASQSEIINHIFDRPLFLSAITMLISSPFLLWLAWSLARPARKLKAAADDVAMGKLKTRPELESGPIEFQAAGVSFNHMVTALQKMINEHQRLISDISHELRTPLTRLQLAAALQRRKRGDNVELQRIENEASRLENMINALLTLSRNQFKKEIERGIITTDELWNGIIDDALFEASEVGKNLEIISQPKAVLILGNPDMLCSALENIVRNALRYSNNHITIDFQYTSEQVCIIIDDDGPGVSEEERALIFRPFYRTDEARDRSSGGNGIGLAIVESAITQHEGVVVAEKSPLGGLRVIIQLPIYQA